MGLFFSIVSKPPGFPLALRHSSSFSKTSNMPTTLRRQLQKDYSQQATTTETSVYPRGTAYQSIGTLPYVTDSKATSSSSGLQLRASSIAMTSSTPNTCVRNSSVCAVVCGLAWVGVDDDLLGRHIGSKLIRNAKLITRGAIAAAFLDRDGICFTDKVKRGQQGTAVEARMEAATEVSCPSS